MYCDSFWKIVLLSGEIQLKITFKRESLKLPEVLVLIKRKELSWYTFCLGLVMFGLGQYPFYSQKIVFPLMFLVSQLG